MRQNDVMLRNQVQVQVHVRKCLSFTKQSFICTYIAYYRHDKFVCTKELPTLRAMFSHCTSITNTYRKVASSSTSRLEAHAGYLRLLMKDVFYPYLL